MSGASSRMPRWRKAFLALLGFNWLLMISAGIVDCPTHDPSTSVGVGGHTMIWLVDAFIGLIAAGKFGWKNGAGRWQQILTLGMAVSVLDELAFYFVGVCALNISARTTGLRPVAHILVSGISLFAMLSVPLLLATLVALVIERRHP
jgi:hypothetical protein